MKLKEANKYKPVHGIRYLAKILGENGGEPDFRVVSWSFNRPNFFVAAGPTNSEYFEPEQISDLYFLPCIL